MIHDKYPSLRSDLNDLTAKTPAYAHFESMRILRGDIREMKDIHFNRNYVKELEKKKTDFEDVYFGGEQIKKPDYLA